MVLYTLTLVVVGGILIVGWDYYRQPSVLRARHPLHPTLKPTGSIGHPCGFLGTFLILSLLSYSARKRLSRLQGWGNLRYWLNYHIWMGITGPLLILVHSSFKVGGIIAVAFWSMVLVVLSGFLGRFVYIQIPHDIRGRELSGEEIAETLALMEQRLINLTGLNREELGRWFERLKVKVTGKGLLVIIRSLGNDLRLLWLVREFKAFLTIHHNLDPKRLRLAIGTFRQYYTLSRRRATLATARRILHHWHIFHRPLALTMIIIAFIHIMVAFIFGYRWIF